MGTPRSKRKAVELSRLAQVSANYRQALADIKQMQAYADGLKKQLVKGIGNAEEATIGGVLMYTYAKTGSYAWAKFAEEHGEIADKYRIVVQKEGLDTEAILRDHPNLVADYQSRQFLVK